MANPFDLRNPVRNATRSAINKTLRKAFTAASRKVRQVYVIKAADFKKFTKINNATNANPEAQLKIRSKKGLPIDVFTPRPVSAGVTVKIKKTGGRKLIRGRFFATMPSGLISVFERSPQWRHRRPTRGPKARGKILHGLPIERLYTIDPAKMFEVEGESVLKSSINTDLRRIFESQLNFFINKT
jgi:hypothetical protein